MTSWLKSAFAALRVIGRFLSLLRRIPLIDDLCDRASTFLFSPVIVRLIRRPNDPDLDAALHLYEKRIPEEQRVPSEDIVRWIRDNRNALRNYAELPTDWFLVAKYRRRVCGFILFHYFPKRRLAFCAYMVVANTPGVPLNAVPGALCAMMSRLLRQRKELKKCRMLLLEVDDPRISNILKKQEECLARIRRFSTLAEMQSLSLRALDIAYRQPCLSLNDASATERPLLLLFALTLQPPLTASAVDRADVENILSFIYTDLYPEGFSTVVSENEAYRAYCASVLAAALSALPQPILSLSGHDVVTQALNKRAKKHQRRPTRPSVASASPQVG
jgi:hypothetical protein